ncbi:hypothetical protein CAPTEDRAFT_130967, partial [Capitella teleta]
VPSGLGGELVEILRKETKLSHAMSQTAVKLVLTHLANRMPSLNTVMVDLLNNVYDSNSKVILFYFFVGNHDTERLSEILMGLAECKEDSQQRSWFLHEDEHKISSYLEELISIAGNADPNVTRRVIAQDKYQAIHDLVLYYQMETRVTLRLLLLQAFGILCSLHAQIISELLGSVLPLELARDMLTDFQDKRKLMFSGLLLSMIFCMGEAIPIQYYEHLNESFISYLIDGIERPVTDGDEQIPDTFLRLILSYNLHFELPEENIIMRALASRGTAKTFTEMLMLLVNRQDDPVRMFEHEPRPPNSVLKFLSDLYSTQKTANLLYRNDAMVLIDIVLRQLTDLSAGDGMRTEYLSLLHLILSNSDYVIHKYRQKEIGHCLTSIINEEGSESQMDKHIVKRIWTDFSGLFSNSP